MNDNEIFYHSSEAEDDSLEFKVFCESGERLRQSPGNATVVADICLERSDFEEDDLLQVLIVVIILGVGVIVREALRRLKLGIPYTVVIFFVGLIVGQIAFHACPLLHKFITIAHIKPQLILMTFLPVLIFESAFSINVYLFRRTLVQILLVAGPGMLFSTFLTAFVSVPMLPDYKWSFIDASLFGSIISATDPVAVVAILRELGAPESLSVFIEGESLLNDGMAVLLFRIFEDLIKGETSEKVDMIVLHGFLKFLRIGVGGPVFGYIMGKISIFSLSKVYNDTVVEISLTMASAYLTYFVGEEFLGVSGILAVVVLGLTLKSQSTCISPQSEGPLKHFWEVLGYMANTLLFFLIGLIIGSRAFQKIEFMDFPYLLFLYAAISLIRFLMLILFKPILQKLGYGFPLSNCLVGSWGGLRGGVGLCLALEIYEDPLLCGREMFGSKILFQTAGIVLLTLLLNATTTKLLMKVLHMTGAAEDHDAVMEYAVKVLQNAHSRIFNALRATPNFSVADWDAVLKCTIIKQPSEKVVGLASKMKRIVERRLSLSLRRYSTAVSSEDSLLSRVRSAQSGIHLEEDNRFRILKAFKISFRRQYEQGAIHANTLKFLQEICIRVEDVSRMITCEDVMSPWVLKEQSTKSRNDASSSPCSSVMMQCAQPFMRMWTGSEQSIVYLCYEIGHGFVAAVDQVVNLLPIICEQQESIGKSRTLAKTKKFLEQEKQEVIRKLGSIEMNFPEISTAAKSFRAARTVINQMKERLCELTTDGLLERDDSLVLGQSLEVMSKKLHTFPKSVEAMSPLIMLNQLEWLKDANITKLVKAKAIFLRFVPGDAIYKIGDTPTGIYLIVTGLVKVQFVASERMKMAREKFGLMPICEVLSDLEFKSDNFDLLGPGSVLGELGYLKEECRAAGVTCETFVTAFYFPAVVLEEIKEECGKYQPPKDFSLRLWSRWGFNVAAALLPHLPPFCDWSPEKIKTYVKHSFVPAINQFSVIEIPDFVSDAIVIEGYFQDFDSKKLHIAPCLIPYERNRLFSKRNPMTVNRLLLVTHEDVSVDVQHQFLNKRHVSFISKTLGEINSGFETKTNKVMGQGQGRMDARQRRKSLAIVATTGSDDFWEHLTQ